MRRFENAELVALSDMIADISGIVGVELMENEKGTLSISMGEESFTGSLPEICEWIKTIVRDAEPPMPLMG